MIRSFVIKLELFNMLNCYTRIVLIFFYKFETFCSSLEVVKNFLICNSNIGYML